MTHLNTEKPTLTWNAADLAACRRGQTVGLHERGGVTKGVTLIDRELIQDEIGGTVHAPTDISCEIVEGDVWVKKELHLDSAYARGAELCFCADILEPKTRDKGLRATLNGVSLRYTCVRNLPRPFSGRCTPREFRKDEPLHYMNGKPFRQYWEGDWHRVQVDPKLLRKGTNTIVLHAPRGTRFQFLIEPSRSPNRSAVSRDGGMTWDYDRLSQGGNIDGEYIVRLALERHPAGGWVEGEPVDLWPRIEGTAVARPVRITSVKLDVKATRPQGTRVRVQARMGSTPAYDPQTWMPWTAASRLTAAAEARHRFLQWRVELSASKDHRRAPRLRSVGVVATAELKRSGVPKLAVCRVDQPAIIRPSHPFVHARNTPRLQLLREDCRLDNVVKGKPRGSAQLRALNAWIDAQKIYNKGGRLLVETPWDGLLFWHSGRHAITGRMCTNRGAFFVQCATALGYPARVVIWSHCIAEAWCEDWQKWTAFDQSGGHYFEVGGVPASVLDMAMAWDGRRKGKMRRKVRQVYIDGRRRPAKPHRPNPKDEVWPLMWFTRFFVPLRSNFLESPEPHEHGHGKYAFKYDGHLRWLHPLREPLPWFAFTTSREADFHFTMNAVNVHLAGRCRDELSVLLETTGPNVARCEARLGGGEWTECAATFPWRLVSGANTLEVRTVSAFDIPGHPARVEVEIP